MVRNVAVSFVGLLMTPSPSPTDNLPESEIRSQNDATAPTLSSSGSQNQRINVDELYSLKMNWLVKPYKNAQPRSGLALGVLEIHISFLEGNEGFSMRNEPLLFENLEQIISFKHNHFYNIESKFLGC